MTEITLGDETFEDTTAGIVRVLMKNRKHELADILRGCDNGEVLNLMRLYASADNLVDKEKIYGKMIELIENRVKYTVELEKLEH